MAQRKPDLRLQAELVFPDGSTKRIDCDAKLAQDQPTAVSFGTQRYTGFAEGQLTLNRRIDLEWPDLGLLNGFNLIGYDGAVAYEGRIGAMPRSLEGSPTILLLAQGWMSHTKDQTFTEVYVDRDLSKWVAPSASRSAALVGENWNMGSQSQLTDEAGAPTVELNITGSWASPYKPMTEAWWPPQPGIELAQLYYYFAGGNSKAMEAGDTNWKVFAFLSPDDKAAVADVSATLWPGPVSAYLGASVAGRRAAMVHVLYNASPAGTAGAAYYARFQKLAVYGNHGLTGHAYSAEEPVGFFVSDMIANIASRYAPKLDTSGIQETTFPVPHASFLEETAPYDAFQALNAYHRWEMAVYENRKLSYYPIDLTDWDWELRESDAGTTLSLQGDEIENLCNGVIVRYRSLTTGYEERLTPATHAELRDESPDNPANLNGTNLYKTLALSVPTTEEAALQIGRIFLAEFNAPKATGEAKVMGHIRDRAGHWQPGWKVRSGDRIVIGDLPNPQVRVVGNTKWDHDRKQLSIAIDGSFKRLDSILARLGIAVESSGLSLP